MGDDEDGDIIVYSSGPDMCLRAMYFTVDILRLIFSYYPMDIHYTYSNESKEFNLVRTINWVSKVNQKGELECNIRERVKQINK